MSKRGKTSTVQKPQGAQPQKPKLTPELQEKYYLDLKYVLADPEDLNKLQGLYEELGKVKILSFYQNKI